MVYSRKFYNTTKLEDMQNEREDMEGNEDLKREVQGHIDAHFFGPPKRKKTRKEKRKERRLAKQQMREEEY
jgi:hypothetical protein